MLHIYGYVCYAATHCNTLLQGIACNNGGDVDAQQAYNLSALSIFKQHLDSSPSGFYI